MFLILIQIQSSLKSNSPLSFLKDIEVQWKNCLSGDLIEFNTFILGPMQSSFILLICKDKGSSVWGEEFPENFVSSKKKNSFCVCSKGVWQTGKKYSVQT